MHYTLDLLVKGDAGPAQWFPRAAKKWRELLIDKKDAPLADWSEWIDRQQIAYFEMHCGGRWIGQEVMGWSGFASLYTTSAGFDEDLYLAIKLLRAIHQSMVSIEVKGHAYDAAMSYSLYDVPEAHDILKHRR